MLLMVSTLGDPQRFINVWWEEVERARNRKRWAWHAMRFCDAIIRQRQAVLKMGNVCIQTEDNQQADLQESLRQCFLEERTLVSAAARQAGVTIVWPADVQTESFHE